MTGRTGRPGGSCSGALSRLRVCPTASPARRACKAARSWPPAGEDPVGGRVAAAADSLLGGESIVGRLGVRQVSGRAVPRAPRSCVVLFDQERSRPAGGAGTRGQAQGQHPARDAAAGFARDDTGHRLRTMLRWCGISCVDHGDGPVEPPRGIGGARRRHLVVVELVARRRSAGPAIGRGPARSRAGSPRSRAARAKCPGECQSLELRLSARARCPTTWRSRHRKPRSVILSFRRSRTVFRSDDSGLHRRRGEAPPYRRLPNKAAPARPAHAAPQGGFA